MHPAASLKSECPWTSRTCNPLSISIEPTSSQKLRIQWLTGIDAPTLGVIQFGARAFGWSLVRLHRSLHSQQRASFIHKGMKPGSCITCSIAAYSADSAARFDSNWSTISPPFVNTALSRGLHWKWNEHAQQSDSDFIYLTCEQPTSAQAFLEDP